MQLGPPNPMYNTGKWGHKVSYRSEYEDLVSQWQTGGMYN